MIKLLPGVNEMAETQKQAISRYRKMGYEVAESTQTSTYMIIAVPGVGARYVTIGKNGSARSGKHE